LVVYPLLFSLLVLDVFLNHLGIQTHYIHTIASGPKLITPIGFLPEIFVLVKYSDGCATFLSFQDSLKWKPSAAPWQDNAHGLFARSFQ
jgi:hypothetical protein